MSKSGQARIISSLAATCLGILLTVPAVAAPPVYDLTILRPLAGNSTSQAQFGVNENASSVGTSGGAGLRFATVWNRAGTPAALARPAIAIFSRATDINNCGAVVGAVDTSGAKDLTGLRATRWSSAGKFKLLLPENGFDSDALSINDSGWVTGIRFNGSTFTPFVLSARGRLLTPAPLAEGDDFELLSINRRNAAAGFDAGEGGTFAVRWSEGVGVENLGLLPGGTFSASAAINDYGMVGGVADDASGTSRAVRWAIDGTIIELESLDKAAYSDSQGGINNRGYSVGVTVFEGANLDDFNSQRATLWTRNGKPFNLNRLIAPRSGYTLLTATGISNSGAIYGDALSAAGTRVAYLLTPVSHDRNDEHESSVERLRNSECHDD